MITYALVECFSDRFDQTECNAHINESVQDKHMADRVHPTLDDVMGMSCITSSCILL